MSYLISPPALCELPVRRAYVLLLFYVFKNILTILVISVGPIISASTRPIFAKFAGLVELWPQMIDVKLFFQSLKGRCHGDQFCRQNRPQYTACNLHDIH